MTGSKEDHGVEDACYTLTPAGHRPIMFCLCGWDTGPHDSWQEAGEAMDDHIEVEE